MLQQRTFMLFFLSFLSFLSLRMLSLLSFLPAHVRLRRKTVVYITQKHNINVTLAGAFWKASADPLENAPKLARNVIFLSGKHTPTSEHISTNNKATQQHNQKERNNKCTRLISLCISSSQ